jgi:galactose-1-phosphate uridylyltransferase
MADPALIPLSAVVERTRLFGPDGGELEQVIEHRVDPLTSQVASVNAMLGEKAKAFLGAADVALLEELQESSRAGCPFCGAARSGTRFPPEFAAGGLLRLGDTLAIPNLFSKCARDAVVVVDCTEHALFASRLGADDLANAIRLCAEIVRRARAADPAAIHHVAGMNFLQPGGSSVPHPHFQVHARGVPYSGVARLARAGAEFLARTGEEYWAALLAREQREGARWIGATGRVAWLAPWAPAHQKEVWGVLPGTGSLAELGDADAAGFAAGIARVVTSYERAGSHAFTLAFLSSPEPGRARELALQVRLCARPAFRPLYANYDSWFTPKLLGDEVHTEPPEAWAARLRAAWA